MKDDNHKQIYKLYVSFAGFICSVERLHLGCKVMAATEKLQSAWKDKKRRGRGIFQSFLLLLLLLLLFISTSLFNKNHRKMRELETNKNFSISYTLSQDANKCFYCSGVCL